MSYIKITLTSLFLSCCYLTSNLTYANGNDIYNKNAAGVVIVVSGDSMGSGVVLSRKGHVLTNWHVIKDSKELEIICGCMETFEESVFQVEIIKVDQKKDLALIKIIGPPFTLLTINVSKIMAKVGDQVHAIGHPGGEIWSYTNGYISQIRYDYEWNYDDGTEFIADVYQSQTPISTGSSGGPLFNSAGNMIGMNTFGKDKNGGAIINFTITVEEIIKFLAN